MIKNLFDSYALKARVAPSLFVLVPAYFAALALVPGLRTFEATALISVAGLIVLVFLADVVRDRGKAAELELYRRWGGKPTTRTLRLRTTEDERTTHEIRELAQAVSGRPLPDETLERSDPARADAIIEEAVSILRERTRHGYPVVISELTAYGRKRNTWAIRRLGRATAALSFALSALAAAHPALRGLTGLPWPVGISFVNLVLVAYWFLEVRERWVQDAAERYAIALFWAATSLRPSTGVAS